MSVAAHGICPNYNRCNKYLEFTLKLDAHEERDRGKNAVIAAQAKRIAELEAMLNGGDSDAGGGKEDAMPKKPFGSSTPSSKIPIKPNSEEEARRRRGGRPKAQLRVAVDGRPPHTRDAPHGNGHAATAVGRPGRQADGGVRGDCGESRDRRHRHPLPQ